MGPRFRGGPVPINAGTGFCPCARRRIRRFRGGAYGSAAPETPGIKRKKGHLVDALALRGDEGRGTLRKARGRCERSVIPGCPNGATPPARVIAI
jgi:hypothetical protein